MPLVILKMEEKNDPASADKNLTTIIFLLQFLKYRVSEVFSRLQMTCETAANMFRGCLARKNYAVRALPTHISQFALFSH